MDRSSEQQPPSVLWLHRIPRFGHSNRLAHLASDDVYLQNDYVDGIFAFSIMIAMIAILWAIVIFVLKFSYGPDRVGCAAGGNPIDVSSLRKNKLSRRQRKTIIKRNQRTQLIFLACSLCLTTLSFVLMNHGFKPFIESLEGINEAVDSMEEKTTNTTKLTTTVFQLRDNLLSLRDTLYTSQVCPKSYKRSSFSQEVGNHSQMFNKTFSHGVQNISTPIDRYANDLVSGLDGIAHAGDYVQQKIDMIFNCQRLLVGFLIAFNVVNVMLFSGAMLSQNDVYSSRCQHVYSLIFVPIFCLLLIGLVATICLFSSISMINADFCSGGPNSGSAKGTVQDIMVERGWNSSDISYKAFNYYLSGCPGTNPFKAFIGGLGLSVIEHRTDVTALQEKVSTFDIEDMNTTCGVNLSLFNETLEKVLDSLDILSISIGKAENFVACENINPLFRAATQGPICNESVRGLSCILGTTCGMMILALIMLSTRAALYNPVIEPIRRKRREREFKEYAEYMQTFYDTSDWKLDESVGCETSRVLQGGSLKLVATFDTECSDETVSQGDHTPNLPETSPALLKNRIPKHLMGLSTNDRGCATEPAIEYYSSDSEEDEESVGARTSVSALVSRFFLVERRSDDDSEMPGTGRSGRSTACLSLGLLLGAAGDSVAPVQNANSNCGFYPRNVFSNDNESVDESLDLPVEAEPMTPSPKKWKERKLKTPQKTQRFLRRTQRGSSMSIKNDIV